ncbi:HMG-Y-related protein B-like [Phalaenopsis equestris]|uniref:HMG-Y-related protein B-like n=1 Tax=Phalaenopsis equestris TaxID=78828 RepID=UPI0009E4FEA8|nr:HMG-Y-related protein B-like [Phalaenopsis equestris]
MATTAEESNSASNPSYPELIRTAISALGETEGSSKLAIIEYIEATYADSLGEGYTAAISESLTKLKESGELLFENNLYIKPYPNSQPRRGRGRPKKPKPALPPGSSPPTPRSRGRPPKPKDPQSNAVNSVAGTPRRRGRPPKPKNSQSNTVTVKIPRRRGRPKKLNATNVVKTAGGNARRRGRPPKKNQPVISAASKAVAKGDVTATPVSGVKRGRGRPLKVKPAVAAAQ